MSKEIWVDIPGFRGLYQASSHGRIKSLARVRVSSSRYKRYKAYLKGKGMLGSEDKDGYLLVNLSKNGASKVFKIHRLVLKSFKPKPKGKDYCNHINGKKDDNRLENLEWCSRSENIQHAWKTGLYENVRKKIICVETGIRYNSLQHAARKLNLNRNGISLCARGKRKSCGGFTWKFT